ncbi:MAG: alcohol dehydrogenase catalytic domain-containing protein [Rhodospirillaceae bacterium]|nr:alcohol dehydrogenase catalytic domain-containing protein [Rhodospirillaceae bacterium]
MKAAVFVDVENIQVKTIPDPMCGPDDIVIKIYASGICGSDIRNYHAGLRGGVKNQVIGHEAAGEVVEVGANVERYRIGDRVAVAPDVSCGECYYCKRGLVNLCVDHRMLGVDWPGGLAEFLHVPKVVQDRGMIHHMPGGLSYDGGALAEPAASVVASQELANITLGSTVLIIGDGPIGCLHLAVARGRGASAVMIAGRSRVEGTKRFNPDLLIDAARQDTVAEVLIATDGLGADVAICANASTSTQEQAVEAVRKRGRVVLFGGVPKAHPMTSLNSNLIHYNEISVVGAFSYPAYMHQEAIRTVASGVIDEKMFVNKTVSLDDTVEGFRAAEAGEALKVMVKPWA